MTTQAKSDLEFTPKLAQRRKFLLDLFDNTPRECWAEIAHFHGFVMSYDEALELCTYANLTLNGYPCSAMTHGELIYTLLIHVK